MWLIRLITHYLLSPTLSALLGLLLWGFLLDQVLLEMVRSGELSGEDIEVLGVVTVALVSALVATFVQRTFVGD